MYKINKDDMSIYVTRGDGVLFDVQALTQDQEPYTFAVGERVRFKVTKKKKTSDVVLVKDKFITEPTQVAQIFLSSEDTKLGGDIIKPTDYWYEVELNPDTEDVQTIIGYDEDGAKIFKLFPEGADIEGGTDFDDDDEENNTEDVGSSLVGHNLRGRTVEFRFKTLDNQTAITEPQLFFVDEKNKVEISNAGSAEYPNYYYDLVYFGGNYLGVDSGALDVITHTFSDDGDYIVTKHNTELVTAKILW